MSTQPQRSLRLLPKSASELNKLTGNRGEIFYDPSEHTLRIFNSVEKGGFSLLRADLTNIAGGSSNVDFGTRTVEAAGFIGTISSISNHDLDDLGNVDVAGATNGQILYYNADESKWMAISLASTFNGGSIANPLTILSAAPSSTTGTGALIVTGGAGIGGAVHVGTSGTFGTTLTAGTGLTVSANGASITGNSTVTGTLSVTSTLGAGNTTITGTLSVSSTSEFTGNLTLRTRAELRLNDTDNTNHIALKAPTNLTTNTTYVLPSVDGTNGQVLITNGSGVLSWSSVSGGGGGGGSSNPPGGTSGSIQYNNSGAFGGSGTFAYDSISDTVSVFNVTATGDLNGDTSATLSDFASIGLATGATVDEFSTDGTFTDNSDTAVPTEAAVKTYVDTGLGLKADAESPTFTGTVSGITSEMVGLGNVENTALTTWTGSSSITTVGTLTDVTVAGDITANNNVVINKLPTSITHAANKKYVDSRSIAMSIALS